MKANKKKTTLPTENVDSFEELETILNKKPYRRWIYRGQADSEWDLISGYLRYARKIQPLVYPDKGKLGPLNRHEKSMLKRFQAHAHLYLSNLPSKTDTIEWLALMQHHGTPTRMLDWSFSPYIALFFAIESTNKPFSLYCIKPSYFKRIDQSHFKDNGEDFEDVKKEVFLDRRGSKSFLYAYEPKFQHERLVAQQALFTISSTNYQSYEEVIDYYPLDKEHILKLDFQPTMIPIIMDKLSLMNISASTLFPGLDGFCRSLKHQLTRKSCYMRLC